MKQHTFTKNSALFKEVEIARGSQPEQLGRHQVEQVDKACQEEGEGEGEEQEQGEKGVGPLSSLLGGIKRCRLKHQV